MTIFSLRKASNHHLHNISIQTNSWYTNSSDKNRGVKTEVLVRKSIIYRKFLLNNNTRVTSETIVSKYDLPKDRSID